MSVVGITTERIAAVVVAAVRVEVTLVVMTTVAVATVVVAAVRVVVTTMASCVPVFSLEEEATSCHQGLISR